ncbi:tRNA(His) guanylyltransferase [Histomonas meleagridis]|uniref:tRNA(His) guanylyltransferase n=1 Tax=Histomonas meleagridis TaxID=135588 RepID=UPI00355A6FEC|nr:tRNA(His) guanylyltransferase [Histomonas meleagridis]KAH0806236.1 tRNA(His) guanylyltransferase [Histomonas meleagridis]
MSASNQILLRGTYIVVRVDGRGFTKFCLQHKIKRPIDDRLCNVMLAAGKEVMNQFQDIVFGYGQSDEFSFVLRKSSTLFERNRDLIISSVVSVFTANFVFKWSEFFPSTPLQQAPAFDSRAVLYTTSQNIHDYLSWRQADSHINSLYNYTLCVIMRTGLSGPEATEVLTGTFSPQKNDILRKHGIDFMMLPESHRRGTTYIRVNGEIVSSTEDMILDKFWDKYGYIVE